VADECTKAVFFPIGLHSTYHPDILKRSRPPATLSAPTPIVNLHSKKLGEQQARTRSRRVSAPPGARAAPRCSSATPGGPYQPTLDYLGTRNIAFSVDIDRSISNRLRPTR
jgi:hypothetical protein